MFTLNQQVMIQPFNLVGCLVQGTVIAKCEHLCFDLTGAQQTCLKYTVRWAQNCGGCCEMKEDCFLEPELNPCV